MKHKKTQKELNKELEELQKLVDEHEEELGQRALDGEFDSEEDKLQEQYENQLAEEYLRRIEEEEEQKEKLEEIKSIKPTEEEKKEIIQTAKQTEKYYAYDLFRRLFSQVSFCNDIMGQILFHYILGQQVCDFKIPTHGGAYLDMRIHFLLVQGSGSGKGKAVEFVRKLLNLKPRIVYDEQLGIYRQRPHTLYKMGIETSAGLLNSANVDNKGKVNEADPVKIGILQKYDFIYWEEGRPIFEPGNFNQELQEIFMTVMEPIGSEANVFNKALRNYDEAIPTTCTASVLITTRPVGKLTDMVIKTGLPQRTLFLPRKLDDGTREEMNKFVSLSRIPKSKKEEEQFQQDMIKLAEEIQKIIEFAWVNQIQLNQEHIGELSAYLNEKIQWFVDDLEHSISNDTNRELLHTFISRYSDHMLVLAHHAAIIRKSPTVERADIEYAFNLLQKIYNELKLWIETTAMEQKEVKAEETEIKKIIEKYVINHNNQASFAELVKHISKSISKSYSASSYHVTKYSKGENALIKIDPVKKIVSLNI